MDPSVTGGPGAGNRGSRRSCVSSRRRAFSLIELLVVIGLISVLVGLLLPSLSRVRDAARRVRCAALLKNLGVGWTIYSDRYPESFPPAVSMPSYPRDPEELTIMKALADEVPSPSAWECPADDRNYYQEVGTSYEYLAGLPIYFNPQYYGAELAQLARRHPDLVPILSDAAAYHPSPTVSDFIQTLYHDGHVSDLSISDKLVP